MSIVATEFPLISEDYCCCIRAIIYNTKFTCFAWLSTEQFYPYHPGVLLWHSVNHTVFSTVDDYRQIYHRQPMAYSISFWMAPRVQHKIYSEWHRNLKDGISNLLIISFLADHPAPLGSRASEVTALVNILPSIYTAQTFGGLLFIYHIEAET